VCCLRICLSNDLFSISIILSYDKKLNKHVAIFLTHPVQYSYLHYYSLHLSHIFRCFTYNITLQNSACFTCITVIYTAFRYTVYTVSFYIRYYCTLYAVLCVLHTVFFFTPSVQLCLLRVHNSIFYSVLFFTPSTHNCSCKFYVQHNCLHRYPTLCSSHALLCFTPCTQLSVSDHKG
jgi:hypothetical protein